VSAKIMQAITRAQQLDIFKLLLLVTRLNEATRNILIDDRKLGKVIQDRDYATTKDLCKSDNDPKMVLELTSKVANLGKTSGPKVCQVNQSSTYKQNIYKQKNSSPT
jgi:hypothetical protein